MQDTRDYIIDQAYSLFLNHSYEAVSISELSKAIGFTKGALYHHFKNKEELFKEVVDKYLFMQVSPEFNPSISLAEFIEIGIAHSQSILQSICKTPESFIPINYLSLVIDAFRHYPKFAEEKQGLMKTEIDKIKKVLNNAILTKEIRADIDCTLTALNYFSLMYGVASNLVHDNSPEKAIETLRSQLYEMYKVLKL